ncbi:hypothetical protein [Tumebacillus lipolyticus]|uniref:Uncharacterized protein n=1 Tax=Tumebacillus lipolyticus TaxID=1280370 RepID=A0ABW4ZRC7_9BACL
MNAKQIIEALRQRHSQENAGVKEWAFFEELRVTTGLNPLSTRHRDYRLDKSKAQRIDAWVINCYPSKNFLRVAYEVKVSRSDFLHEIKHQEKRQQALALSNQYFFVVPKGLVKPEEVPEECGLIYVDGNQRARVVKQAPMRETAPPDWGFLCSIARRSQTG